ncbi:MAG: hypothetical protein V3T72_02375 [Thermoanaerobaculia bacterium]
MYVLEIFARALLFLGRVEEARPVVDRLRAAGWFEGPGGDALAELCQRHGLPAGDGRR